MHHRMLHVILGKYQFQRYQVMRYLNVFKEITRPIFPETRDHTMVKHYKCWQLVLEIDTFCRVFYEYFRVILTELRGQWGNGSLQTRWLSCEDFLRREDKWKQEGSKCNTLNLKVFLFITIIGLDSWKTSVE